MSGCAISSDSKKNGDPAEALKAISSEFPSVTDFERSFPSLCFALATGVGKTRLMGAFTAWLFKARNIRHFFVLAPNLTIYNKLIADFTPNTPKYVFQGIPEFAIEQPEIVTGGNYESGRGIRRERRRSYQPDFSDVAPDQFTGIGEVHINIFNISKINSEVRGGKEPRIKRLQEYIGDSYFRYLPCLDDLVLLMDESHRYRASAGVRAINELNPILGLELTATPQAEQGPRSTPFENVIYSYPLSSAMTDGFVKEPAVATRENFDVKNYDKQALERLKLEDGIRIHEHTKVEFEVYTRENQKPLVKPFMLVVAEDTTHPDELMKIVEHSSFFEGSYKGKVITVHSNLRGEEKDETVAQLISVEDRNNPTEIVIHVNMLKEGWDVTNLYTIVPLRAANSKTLVEQSIDIPRIVVVPKGEIQSGFDDLNLDVSGISLQPVAKDILIQHLRNSERHRLVSGDGVIPEARLEDYLVRGLIDFDDLNYDDHAALLYKLASQVVARLQSYLSDSEEIINVLQYHQQTLVKLIHAQMPGHYHEPATTYEAHFSKGFTTLHTSSFAVPADELPRDFRAPVDEKLLIKGLFFGRFRKCLYQAVKFDSDTERRFAVIVEDTPEVMKWFRPAKSDIQIHYAHDSAYEPDFVVETKTMKFLCDLKGASDINDDQVKAKTAAAVTWCRHASKHPTDHGAKPWAYVLIPHDAISNTKTFGALCSTHQVK